MFREFPNQQRSLTARSTDIDRNVMIGSELRAGHPILTGNPVRGLIRGREVASLT